jgi:hypothetical protein
MSAFFLLLITLTCLASRALTYTVEGQILSTEKMSAEFSKTKVVLNDGLYSALVTATGHFKIDDVPQGVYHLDVYEPTLKFRKYKLDVSTKKGGTIRALSRPFPGGEKRSERHPLTIEALAPEAYFRPRGGANPIAMILRNPIFLIMGVMAMVSLFAKPPSPEDQRKQELEQQRQQQQQQQQQQQPQVACVAQYDDDDDDVPPVMESKADESIHRRTRRGKHE